ncbi:MAG TPA: efflux transporter outer membrane subunit [Myxococcota bacterium]|jgi:multidrug efflux system outer membrane protein|nr:efflux transporter outer membrane subunit [Myxococcota bacterium]
MRGRRLVAGVVALCFGSACAVGPNYVRPPVATPDDYRGHVTPPEAASIADLPWWEVFDDDVLQKLVLEALNANYDLQTAVFRVEQARALVGVAQAPFYPQIQYQGNSGRQHQPELLSVPDATFNYFYGVFSLAWELDVWGRIRRSSEAAQQSLLATEEFRRGVLLSLVTGVASAYLTLLELDRELEIARDTAKSFRETRDLFQRRFLGGVGNKLQVSRAEAALAQTEATIPDLERRIVAQENVISVLLGRSPGPIPRGKPMSERPAPPPTPPGLPSTLLERRPDVLQAEHGIASANAEVGVAIANFFPRIGLTALYGAQSTDLSDLVKGAFSVWNVAGNVTGPVFQGFALLEQYRAQVAGWEQTKAQYEQTVITAFSEVSDALTAQTKFTEARAAQERTVAAYQESVRLSLTRYNSGLATYFEVLEAQQQLYPAEISLAQLQLSQLLTVVTLYRSLGGGWQLPDEQWTQAP